MPLRFPVEDLRGEPGFDVASVVETAPFGPLAAGGASPHLVLGFSGVPGRLVAPFPGFVRFVAALGDPVGEPSIVEVQPLVVGDGLALADGLEALAGQPATAPVGLLPRVRLHGVDPALVEAALAARIVDEVTATDTTLEPERVERFRAGGFGVFVDAGALLAAGVAAVGIDVAASDGTSIDPVAYYSHYLSLAPAPGELLVDREWCEVLFGRLTRRALLQVVDEHGQAFTGTVRVVDGSGAPTDVDVSTTGGLLVAATFPGASGAQVLAASFEVPEPGAEAGGQVAGRYLLTSEWPAGPPEPLGPVALAAPGRPAMRRFVVTDLRAWLASQQVTAPGFDLARYHEGNHAYALVDGNVTFGFILRDVRAAQAPGGFYYLTAWAVDVDVPLDGTTPETALKKLLHDLVEAGGTARVIVWDTFHVESTVLQETVAAAYSLAVLLLIGGAVAVPPAGLIVTSVLLAGHALWALDVVDPLLEKVTAKLLGDNAAAVEELEVAGAEVLFDGKVRQTRSDAAPRLYDFVGSHHQKFSVVSGSTGLVAYCGGIDMRTNRLEDARHLDSSPYHDLHCRIAGPAALDLARTFRHRWDDQVGASRTPAAGDGDAVTPPASSAATQVVQVARTYPNGLDLAGDAYPFAPQGDRTIRASIGLALARARRYVYIEDQYLTPPPDLVALLSQRMTDVPELKLVMVIPRSSDQPENTSRRARFIGDLLRDFGPDRVIAMYPTRLVFPHDKERHGPVVSRLRGPLAADAVELPVDDAGSFAEEGTVLVGAEEITYSSRDVTARKLVVGPDGRRGHNGTVADAYADRTRVAQIIYRDIFVHSKLWLVDDVFAAIGSANVNNRGMNHDSEVDVFVVDGRSDRAGRRFAKQLRVDLWAEHLGIGESTASRLLLDDLDRALALLVARPGPAGNRLRRYWHTWNAEHKTDSWGSMLSPGLYWDAFQTVEGPLVDDALWSTYFDPSGTDPLT